MCPKTHVQILTSASQLLPLFEFIFAAMKTNKHTYLRRETSMRYLPKLFSDIADIEKSGHAQIEVVSTKSEISAKSTMLIFVKNWQYFADFPAQ